jgi:hypothetical protein
MLLAFKTTNDVTCSDARSCPPGLSDGGKGESLLLHLLQDKDVAFVRATEYLLRGRVVKIRPSTTSTR